MRTFKAAALALAIGCSAAGVTTASAAPVIAQAEKDNVNRYWSCSDQLNDDDGDDSDTYWTYGRVNFDDVTGGAGTVDYMTVASFAKITSTEVWRHKKGVKAAIKSDPAFVYQGKDSKGRNLYRADVNYKKVTEIHIYVVMKAQGTEMACGSPHIKP